MGVRIALERGHAPSADELRGQQNGPTLAVYAAHPFAPPPEDFDVFARFFERPQEDEGFTLRAWRLDPAPSVAVFAAGFGLAGEAA